MKLPWKCDHPDVDDAATCLVCRDCGAHWRWHVRLGLGRWVYQDKRGRWRFAKNPGIDDPTRLTPAEKAFRAEMQA